MGMELTDIIKQLMNSRQTGLLSVKIEGENFLLKVFLEGGRIVCVSIGEHKDEICIEKIKEGKMIGHFFLRGAKPSSLLPSTIATALNDLIPQISKQIAASDSIAKIVSQAGDGSDAVVGAGDLSDMEAAFIDIMGPIGILILDDRYGSFSYARGKSMPAQSYSTLLSNIIDELPAEKKMGFFEKFKRR